MREQGETPSFQDMLRELRYLKEAEVQAQKIIDDAENRAKDLVSDAESKAAMLLSENVEKRRQLEIQVREINEKEFRETRAKLEEDYVRERSVVKQRSEEHMEEVVRFLVRSLLTTR
jgi:vacuolar-type H+-ATPase subunit H